MQVTRFLQFSVLAIAALFVVSTATAQTLSTPARHAIMIESATGEVLFEKDADVAIPPASMSKMMTVLMAFQHIKDGAVSLDDEVEVSAEAWRKWRGQGSTMFLNAKDVVTIEDLLRGIIVLSGNDACVVLAEALAGSEELFVDWMNTKADEIGLTGSHFTNSNGWPADDHYVTARDLARIAEYTVNEFPEYYTYYAEREYLYKNFTGNRFNRNPVLRKVEGGDGLKTGHTEEAGYGLTASAIRGDRRLILVIAGLDSSPARDRESRRLLNYGFRNFKTYDLFAENEKVTDSDVWLGVEGIVGLQTETRISRTFSVAERSRMKIVVSHAQPIKAPIVAGQVLGMLTITVPGREPEELPLVADRSVGAQTGFSRIGAALRHLLFGSAG